jgi:hypothetical protein
MPFDPCPGEVFHDCDLSEQTAKRFAYVSHRQSALPDGAVRIEAEIEIFIN